MFFVYNNDGEFVVKGENENAVKTAIDNCRNNYPKEYDKYVSPGLNVTEANTIMEARKRMVKGYSIPLRMA